MTLPSFSRLVLLCAALAAPATPALLRAEAPVVCQKTIGAEACGPCAVYNALADGAAPYAAAAARLPGGTSEDRVRSLIGTYGTRASAAYAGHRPRYLAEKGMAPTDLTLFFNEVLRDLGKPGVKGDFLSVRPGETADGHLRRVHDLLAASLAAGLPPVVELRSFGADPDAKSADGYVWNVLCGHFVAVVGVGEATTVGFPLRLADSYTGRVIDAFVYAERHRPFTAARDFTVDDQGKVKWEWLKGGYPFLLVLVPEIPLKIQKEPWHDRTTVTLAHVTYLAAP